MPQRHLQRDGYRPEEHGAGHIRGYFVLDRDGDRYRFVVVDGHHRTAALFTRLLAGDGAGKAASLGLGAAV